MTLEEFASKVSGGVIYTDRGQGPPRIRIVSKMMQLDEHWRQVDGDVNPGAHGAVLARLDGNAIELLEIQPVREYVGDGEAKEVGFPYWSKEGWYSPGDLAVVRKEIVAAMQCCDVHDASNPLEVALACLRYGHHVDEGRSGWAKDVVPGRVIWWHGDPSGPESFADDEQDFMTTVKECTCGVSLEDHRTTDGLWIPCELTTPSLREE